MFAGLLLAVSVRAGSRESAFRAREMIGPDVWSRVIRVENRPAAPDSRYPAEFYGLVVAFEGILWFYTEFDGTQNLSTYRDHLAEDQAGLGALLRQVEPGLSSFVDVSDERPPRFRGDEPLPNGCFVGCVAQWQQLRRENRPPTRARLIAVYPRGKRQGHLLLEFWRGDRRFVFDPDEPARSRQLSARLADDPVTDAWSVLQRRNGLRPVRAVALELRPGTPTELRPMKANGRESPHTRAG